MQELAELHRFNLWANANLLAAVRKLPAEQLSERREGMYDSILSVLTHFAAVEAAYLSLMRSESFEPGDNSLDSLEQSLAGAGRGLVELAATAAMDRSFHIPWFGRDFTVATGLRQVLNPFRRPPGRHQPVAAPLRGGVGPGGLHRAGPGRGLESLGRLYTKQVEAQRQRP
jgi:DinB family